MYRAGDKTSGALVDPGAADSERTMCGYLSGSGMFMSVSLMLRYCSKGSGRVSPDEMHKTHTTSQQRLHTTGQPGRCSACVCACLQGV